MVKWWHCLCLHYVIDLVESEGGCTRLVGKPRSSRMKLAMVLRCPAVALDNNDEEGKGEKRDDWWRVKW